MSYAYISKILCVLMSNVKAVSSYHPSILARFLSTLNSAIKLSDQLVYYLLFISSFLHCNSLLLLIVILSVVCRPEYKQLHLLREHLLGVPFVALTATATERYECFTISYFYLFILLLLISNGDVFPLLVVATCILLP